jgi:hypothetical protein
MADAAAQIRTLDANLERELIALWPTLSSEDQALWFRVLDALLPTNDHLRESLHQLHLDSQANNPDDDDQQNGSVSAAVDRLSLTGPRPPRRYRSWEDTVGAFGNDPVLRAIVDAGREIREAERVTDDPS